MSSSSYKDIQVGGFLEIYQGGRDVMLALDPQIQQTLQRAVSEPVEPVDLSLYGFYSYVEEGVLYTIPGEVRYVDNEVFESGNPNSYTSTTPLYALSGLAHGSSGVLYLEIPTGQGSTGVVSALAGFDVFGDEAFDYYAELQLSSFRLQDFASSFTFSDTTVLKYAVEFADHPLYFRKKIADVTVNNDGVPSVQQIHLGTVHVMVGTGYVSEVSIGTA